MGPQWLLTLPPTVALIYGLSQRRLRTSERPKGLSGPLVNIESWAAAGVLLCAAVALAMEPRAQWVAYLVTASGTVAGVVAIRRRSAIVAGLMGVEAPRGVTSIQTLGFVGSIGGVTLGAGLWTSGYSLGAQALLAVALGPWVRRVRYRPEEGVNGGLPCGHMRIVVGFVIAGAAAISNAELVVIGPVAYTVAGETGLWSTARLAFFVGAVVGMGAASTLLHSLRRAVSVTVPLLVLTSFSSLWLASAPGPVALVAILTLCGGVAVLAQRVALLHIALYRSEADRAVEAARFQGIDAGGRQAGVVLAAAVL